MEASGRFRSGPLLLLFYCLTLTIAQDVTFQAPSSREDVTLVLGTNYKVQWTTEWPAVDLYVFCDGEKAGGEGKSGAQLLYGNLGNSSYQWTVSQVQNCPISNRFHFMVQQAGGPPGPNSPGFRVVATQDELTTTSSTSSTTATATTDTDSLTSATTGSQETPTVTDTSPTATGDLSTTAESEPDAGSSGNKDSLTIGLGAGLGIACALAAALVVFIFFRRRNRIRHSRIVRSDPSPPPQFWDARTDHQGNQGTSKIPLHEFPAEDSAKTELDARQVKPQEPWELEGNR